MHNNKNASKMHMTADLLKTREHHIQSIERQTCVNLEEFYTQRKCTLESSDVQKQQEFISSRPA